jgi:hypothetical protein
MMFESGRMRRAVEVRLYTYDKTHMDTDGEQFGYVRCVIQRNKSESYNVFGTVQTLYEQMASSNVIGCSSIPDKAWRILPNMYLHIIPAVRKIYNYCTIYRMKDNPGWYGLYRAVFSIVGLPTRKELYDIDVTMFNSTAPVMFEHWQIQHLLNDQWANVFIGSNETTYSWKHIKQLKVARYRLPKKSTFESMTDDGLDGDTYVRTKIF